MSDSETDDEMPDEEERPYRKTSLKKMDGIEIVPRESFGSHETNARQKEFSSDSETDDEITEKEPDNSGKKSVRFADDGGESDSEEETHQNYTTDLVGDDPEEKKIRVAESWFSQVRPVLWLKIS